MVTQFPTWKGLNTLGVAIGYRRDSKGKESLEYRYYISSAALTEFTSSLPSRGTRNSTTAIAKNGEPLILSSGLNVSDPLIPKRCLS